MGKIHDAGDLQLTRNVNELLQEIRVAQAGVQILFGFLFSIAFTEVYQQATSFQHHVHLIAVVSATVSLLFLTAPAAWHRVLFRQGRRREIVTAANTLAIVGLGFLAVATSATLLLLTDVVLGRLAAVIICVVAILGFSTLWFLIPLQLRRRND